MSHPPSSLHPSRGLLASCLAAVALGLLFNHPVLAVGIASCFLAIVVLCAVPLSAVPAIALASFALVPSKQLPFPGEPATFSVTLMVVLIWVVRAGATGTGRDTGRVRALGILLSTAGAIVLSSFFSAQVSTSVGWTFSFLCLGLVPVILLQLGDRSSHEMVRRTWVVLGGLLGAFAVAEKFLLSGNPIYDFAYHSAKPPLLQVWSTYRSTTTLGHPLTNALFFAVACVLAQSAWRSAHRRQDLLWGALAAFGLIATVSRGGLVALGAGLVTVSVLQLAARGSERGRRFALPGLISVFGVIVLFGSGAIADRNNSSEGSSSYLYRATTVQDGLRLTKGSPIVGVGVGSADAVRKANATGKFRAVGLENSWVGLVAGLGLPGTVCIFLLMGLCALTAVRRGDLAAVGVLATYVVMAASYNLLEQNRPAHVIFGLVLGLALGPGMTSTNNAERLTEAIGA